MYKPYLENIDNRKLAHAYVALAFAQEVARGYINQRPEQGAMVPLITALEITSRLLEEILEDALPEDTSNGYPPRPGAELLM